MEQQSTNTDLFSSDLKIDDTARRHITGIAQWVMIVVVTAIIGYVLTLLEIFMGPAASSTSDEGFMGSYLRSGSENAGGSIFWIIIGLLMNYFLYQFAVNARKGVASVNQELMARSFRSLKIYFIIFSVILIIIFLLVLVAVAALS